ncbi:MAG: membrane protein insertase YidC [Deltaproteobacteria bacterium]|nr:membrane protein insertase YidC [Deltaproteobacteria bacterium]
MENSRMIIAIVLSMLVFLVWEFFFSEMLTDKDKAKKVKTAQIEKEIPKKEQVQKPYIKEKEIGTAKELIEEKKELPSKDDLARIITVNTPLYSVKISEKGALFNSFVLKKYRETVELDSPYKEIIVKKNEKGSIFFGLEDKSIDGIENALFSTNLTEDTLNITNEGRKISFSWESPQGILFEKTFFFSPEEYTIGLNFNIKNGSDHTFNDKIRLSLVKYFQPGKAMYGFEGPSALINNKLEQIDTDDIEEKSTFSGTFKWLALQDRYFMSSILPANNSDDPDGTMKLLFEDNILEARYILPRIKVHPGTQKEIDYKLFFGPKSMKILKKTGHRLQKVIDFGMFDILAKPCLWIMNFVHDNIIQNYGIAIILLTIFTKILLWPLGSKSYKSMGEMKKIQPLMAEIKEKYKNDKKKMNEEVMSLYRTYKINPLGGCLPMLVQLPVFFALYRMLYEAIELRHAPFFLWINDLSAPDRLFNFDFAIPFMQPPYGIPVLTVIMGATMLLQQKMSPPMGDAMQAKMMMLMPVVFTVIFINFSSGLVLYWLINNVLSIAQQQFIQKKNA